jgi:hypothetical protein
MQFRFAKVQAQLRQSGIAAARGELASSERDERLVSWLIFSWRFLGDFLESPGSRRSRPQIRRGIWVDGTEFRWTDTIADLRIIALSLS